MSRRSSNALQVILAIAGVVALLGLGTCVGVYFVVKRGAAMVAAELADSGAPLVLGSPPAVTTALAGAKRAYVGHWRSTGGSALDIDATGAMTYDRREGGSKEKIDLPISAFHGDDIEAKAFVTLTIRVSSPPRRAGGHWEMVADGVTYERP
jgi:hypothetical protein